MDGAANASGSIVDGFWGSLVKPLGLPATVGAGVFVERHVELFAASLMPIFVICLLRRYFLTKARRQRVASTFGRPQIEARQPGPVDPATAPVSLPLQEASKTENTSLSKSPKKPCWYLPEDSKVRTTAVKIVMMKSVAGMSNDDIGAALGISPKSIAGYLYKAGKNGWLDFDNPKDNLEYTLMHKVVRNLEESLDSTNILASGQSERTATALKIAEGALFPKLAVEAPQQASAIVGIKIQMVEGQQAEVRAGTVMGANTYLDGVVEEAE